MKLSEYLDKRSCKSLTSAEQYLIKLPDFNKGWYKRYSDFEFELTPALQDILVCSTINGRREVIKKYFPDGIPKVKKKKKHKKKTKKKGRVDQNEVHICQIGL